MRKYWVVEVIENGCIVTRVIVYPSSRHNTVTIHQVALAVDGESLWFLCLQLFSNVIFASGFKLSLILAYLVVMTFIDLS